MIRNFSIRDGVIFSFPQEIDLRGNCELLSVTKFFGSEPSVEMDWNIIRSNRGLRFKFTGVVDFQVTGRDSDYPYDSGITLGISGFCKPSSNIAESEFFVEPSKNQDYLGFVMDDKSAFLIKSGSGYMQSL